MLQARLGIAPIAWWNDDLESLSDDVSLDECLRQAATAGLSGMETGRRFPMNMAELGPTLARYGMSVCGGWFSGLLLDGDIEAEKDRIAAQLTFFKEAGAPCIVYGETARSVQGERYTPLAQKPRLTEAEMAVYGRKISDFSDWCAAQGMPISYHHHMAAVVETEAELDMFMQNSINAAHIIGEMNPSKPLIGHYLKTLKAVKKALSKKDMPLDDIAQKVEDMEETEFQNFLDDYLKENNVDLFDPNDFESDSDKGDNVIKFKPKGTMH